MKTFISILAFIAIGLSQQGGCVSTGALPFVSQPANVQASTFTVQVAEKICNQALISQKLFFGLVHNHHDFIAANLPEVMTFAKDMQVRAPEALRRANRARRAFKYNRTPENEANMNTLILTLQSIMSDVEQKTTELKAVIK